MLILIMRQNLLDDKFYVCTKNCPIHMNEKTLDSGENVRFLLNFVSILVERTT